MSSFSSSFRNSYFAAFIVVILVGVIAIALFALQKPSILKNLSQFGSTVSDLDQPLTKKIEQQGEFKKFSNTRELLAFLEQHSTNTPILPSYVFVPTPLGFGGAFEGSAGAALDVASYSQTNIQVPGVDEADIVKTDGKYIYALSYQNLYIIEAYPPESAKIVAQIPFEGAPQELYVEDDVLVVYGADWASSTLDKNFSPNRVPEFTFFQVFDIRDRAKPKKIRDLSFEGIAYTSRRIDDYVYLVLQRFDATPDPLMPVPYVLENGEVLPNDPTATRCNCPDVFYLDSPQSLYQFTTIAAINMRKSDEPFEHQVYVIPASHSLYVSENAMYLTYTKYVEPEDLSFEVMMERMFDRLDQVTKDKIRSIEKADEEILSAREKRWKILELFGEFKAGLSGDERTRFDDAVAEAMKAKYKQIQDKLETTVVYKFMLDNAKVVAAGSAEVPGRVNNQFSMDESSDSFRIATTKGPLFAEFLEDTEQDSWTNVYVLDNQLKIVGRLEGLAQGESIYASRFLGDRVYLVTFEQTDPLFAIDLSDPRKPTLLGELKIPGFSTYLHPYSENILIGLGHETDVDKNENVSVGGLKVSLFDVSDVKELREIDSYAVGGFGSDSEALREHKAFLFSKEKSLLVFPTQIYKANVADPSDYEPVHEFTGAIVFHIDENGLEERGRVTHVITPPTADAVLTPTDFTISINRSLYINDVLYTFSQDMLLAHALGDLSEKTRVQFPGAFVPPQPLEPGATPPSL